VFQVRLLARCLKPKFHYAIQLASWFEAGSKLVADPFETKFRYAICDQLRAGSSYLDKAKFHYAFWSQTGSKLVVDLSQTC